MSPPIDYSGHPKRRKLVNDRVALVVDRLFVAMESTGTTAIAQSMNAVDRAIQGRAGEDLPVGFSGGVFGEDEGLALVRALLPYIRAAHESTQP